MSYTLFMSPFLEPLLGDAEVNEFFSPLSELSCLLAFEVALAKAQEKHGVIPKGVAKALDAKLHGLKPDEKKIATDIARDGVLMPSLVAMLKHLVGPKLADHIHAHATSQDAIDTSLMLRAMSAFDAIAENLIAIQDRIAALRTSHGSRQLIGRTRMQQALPITVSNRLDAWENNITNSAVSIANMVFPLQLFGPVGTYADQKVRDSMAETLNLIAPSRSWQNDRGPILDLGNISAGLTGAVGKIGADIALMAQNEFAEIKLSGGGTSSAMAHKQNPVKAEVLVSLARFNASLLSALHNAAVHEQERSGAAWTLEWLVLPQMICAAGGAARVGRNLLESVESIGA
jgi:3-carboxy-cis,cis-muconate cycloisomerase